MELAKVSEEYLEQLEKIRRYSENTLKAYCTDLKEFINYCKESEHFELTSITERFIHSYMMKLNQDDLDVKSISRKLSAIRGFFKYSYNKGLISKNPASGISNPKIHRKLPDIASEKSIYQVYKYLDETAKDPLLIKVIFELLYGCALRVSELCSLKSGSLDLEKGFIKVKGKGNKERIVPVGSKSIEIINAYLLTVVHTNINTPFILRGGKGINPRYVQRIVEKYLSRFSGIEKNSPHILRHTAATHMLDAGADLTAVKEILGHESLSTTQIYTHVSVERLKKAYKKAHPKS